MTPRRSVILSTTANGLTPVLLVVSVYLTFRGHNAPGGGFSGGLVMSTAVVLRYLAEGSAALDRLRLDPVALIGAGLLLAVLVAGAPLVVGGDLLESAIWEVEVPPGVKLKLVSSTLFDLGVHLLVVGTVVTLVVAFVRTSDTDPQLPGGAR
jgi:multisubunit Na+/H+ antiporter MnhB subunit